MSNPHTVILKLTSAVAIAGMIVRAGELVEVTKLEAADLVQRGRAVVVGSNDAADFDDEGSDETETEAKTEGSEAEGSASDAAQEAASDATVEQAAEDAAKPADAAQEAAQPANGGRRSRSK